MPSYLNGIPVATVVTANTSSRTTLIGGALMVGGGSGLVVVDLIADGGDRRAVSVSSASEPRAHQLAETRRRLTEHRAQWLYFNRNLRIYEGSRTYVLKPLQRFHWTRTQAIQDAGEIIADCLELGTSTSTR